MKKWQAGRNYRRIRDAEGNVIANIITVDGADIPVSEEVFRAYAQADRRERYLTEDIAWGRLVSLEQLAQDHVPLACVGENTAPSAEAHCLELEELREHTARMQMLASALCALNAPDRELVAALFWQGISVRQYAKRLGISDTAVRKRRDRILRFLKSLMA